MKYKNIIFMGLSVVLFPLSNITGQTLFTIPDTTPDYISYRYIDECISAYYRLDRFVQRTGPVWNDTVTANAPRYLESLSQQVVEPMKKCLAGISLDSIPLNKAAEYSMALFAADRDDDVERLFLRLQDSMIADKDTKYITDFLSAYIFARPSRLEKMEKLYHDIKLKIHPDSVFKGIQYRTTIAWYLEMVGNQEFRSQIAKELVEITDTLSDKTDPRYLKLMRFSIYPLVSSFMPQEAVDSLMLSTDAYRNYLASIWESMAGYSGSENEIGSYAIQATNLTGNYWYSNSGGKIDKISPLSLNEVPTVSIIYFVQGGCHSNSINVMYGRNNGRPSDCWRELYKIRKVMEQYPTIKLFVVTNTFGSFADAPPLTPEQEADTLADYFLNFHKLKGTQVVYKTEFIRLPGYDNRRVDMETENQLAYKHITGIGHNTVVLIDERGKIFHYGVLTGPQSIIADARIKAVMSRPGNRSSAIAP